MVKSDALRKRYVLFEYKGPALDSEQLKKSFQMEALKFFGELGMSYAAIKLVQYDPTTKLGILRCERDYLDKVCGFLALINSLDGTDARLISRKSSGTIKSLDQPNLNKQKTHR
ncbi:Ribonuclease P protein component 2 [Candidatus Bilamarchaeum dharawalense]|uniref:Ribonuclease P protein component 2 n=1 Tax=Candidatus Bilamarchaeum dharawalense TaxID=2885759 RepID=A0A5E4LYL7_9ARCH|nr:Ribonuclease P protein component 2 [Candidatus Bilamarchaeum dharawalense]